MLSKLLVENLQAFEQIEIYRSTLQKTFGLSPEKAFSALISRKLDINKEDVDAYASDLVQLANTVFPHWESVKKDELATRFFWEGLPNTLNTKQLHALFKRDPGNKALANALDICRDAFEVEAQVHVVSDRYNRPYRGKGKGKGWNVLHNIRKPPKKFQNNTFMKCKQCGGRGHKEDVCPTSQQVCAPLIIEKCQSTGLKFLIDTGATVSVLNLDKAPEVKVQSTRLVNTINGTKMLSVVPYLNLMGVKLDNCLGQKGPLLYLDGVEIDGILGMDYIKAVGGFHVAFDDNNQPKVAFNEPSHAIHALTQEPTILKRIEMSDFVLEQHLRLDPDHPEWKYKWVVSWKWLDGPKSQFGPVSYNCETLPTTHKILLEQEVQGWFKGGFIDSIDTNDRHKVAGLLSLIAVEQLHKPTTPVRPVLDYRWLNKHIKSSPNEGLEYPVSAPMCLRRWRAHETGTMCLIDIKKAYLQIFVAQEQTWYQCLRFPTEHDFYRLTRLGFGLSISPKVLRVVLSEILPSDSYPSIDTYIDDNFLPVADAETVRIRLREHGFDTKEPEPVNQSRVLGLQNSPDGTWKRRGPTPKLEKLTKRGVHSWTGKLVCHLPIAKWLRPCASAIKRMCAVQDWDEPLDAHAIRACNKLTQWLEERGDPCNGQWSYNPVKPWTLYTDASCTAYGAVLKVGDVSVEDQTYLRAPGDRRHINLAELIAVHKGIHLVALYRKALRITEPATINLKCDSKSVVAWLKRAQERHWTSIKGLSAKVIEKQLLAISDDCQALGIKLQVDLIPSEANLADPLSRVPDFLRGPEQPFDPLPIQNVVCSVTTPQTAIYERDQYNRLIIDDETLRMLQLTMHEHEGAQTLYDRLRGIVSCKELRKKCQEFVRNCAVCGLSKVIRHAPIISEDAHMPRAITPFSHVHIDISGPYGSIDNIDKFYVMSLIDRHTRYVLTRPTANAPQASDCSALLHAALERFHVCVDFVYTDGGSQFVSAEFTRVATDLGCSIVTTPVQSSWANGRVERWHRTLNEFLRSHLGDGLPTESFRLFDSTVARATLLHNTTRSSRTGESPHDMIFTFPSWIYPLLKHFRPSPMHFEDVPDNPVPEEEHPQAPRRKPKVGEIWLYRVKQPRKLDRPYVPCRIVGRLSSQVYLIRFRSRAVKKVHLRHLKPLTQEGAEQLPDLPLPIPPDDRPLRDLRGGGGHVVDTG